jgi:glycosyltransferase involved in cell wall biosynthesis
VRILYLADIRFPLERANGIQTMETCHALAARGHAVTLLVRPDTRQPPQDPFAFYEVPALDALRIERALVAGPQTSRRAAYVAIAVARGTGQTRQDLIFTRDLGLASVLLRLPRRLRAPIVYEAHGIAAETAAALPTLLSDGAAASPAKLQRLAGREARVWQRADGYVTITAGLADALRQRFGSRDALAIVPDGTRIDDADAAESVPRDPRGPEPPFIVGYAGHLYPWQGVDLVIDVISRLPDTRGLIVGGHEAEPDLARLKALATRLGSADRIMFTGMLAPRDARRRLQDVDVLVLPNPASAISNRFTSPLKLFDYMASKRPIVASNLPSIREILHDKETALLVDAGNADAIAAGIRTLQADRALGARLATRAFDEVKMYTWSERARRLEALFDTVIG